MKYLVLAFAIIGTSLAAPWVVLDSRNDMLAMSSEISDGAVAYAVLPPATTLGSVDDEPATSGNVAVINDDSVPATTEEQPQADLQPAPEPEPELSPEDVVQATVKPAADDIQQDMSEVTTVSASTSSVGSLMEDDIQSEDINLKVIPDTPITTSRQNPNSIEEVRQIPTVTVISKKKHDIFSGKKSKFTM